MKISFLLSFIPNPRMERRIKLLKNKYKLSLIYWNRNFVAKKVIIENVKIHEVKVKADFNLKHLVKRLFNTFKFRSRALKLLKEIDPEIIYVQNIDMLSIAYKYQKQKSVKIIYEIADISSLVIDKQKGIINKVFSFLLKARERKYLKKTNLLVITSPKYYEEYFYRLITIDKVFYMPNIPDTKVFKNFKRKQSPPFTIGFIGVIRYENEIKMLIDAAEKAKVNVFIAGNSFTDEIKRYSDGKDFVTYYGAYNYKEEISMLYSRIDCIYAVYDTKKKNVRLALPNRLYEAIYLELPIIVSKDTYLEEVVKRLNVGESVDPNDAGELYKALIKLKTDKDFYNNFVLSCKDKKKLINAAEYERALIQKIESL